MTNDLNASLKRLWLTYKLYHSVAVTNGSDANEYATESANEYLKYLETTTSGEMPYNWDLPLAIENQIRIIRGFISCYDKPIKRDKLINKSRWSV